MTTVILTRHGHVDWIAPERFLGRAALSLTDTGQRQAEATAAFIRSAWPEAAAVYTTHDAPSVTRRALPLRHLCRRVLRDMAD